MDTCEYTKGYEYKDLREDVSNLIKILVYNSESNFKKSQIDNLTNNPRKPNY